MPNNNSLSTYTTMMRVTSSGRPYVKDLFDLFSALLIQLPLTDHRSLFRVYPNTFTTEEAIKCLADLTFTHVVRTIDPNDTSRHVATRTTTSFSMSAKMAKTLGTHILNARLAEDAGNRHNRTMKDKGIWRPTPKGKYMIQEFSKRAQVSIQHMEDTLARIQNFKIFGFERLRVDDRLAFTRANMTNAFRTMFAWLPMEQLMADDIGSIKVSDLYEFQYTFYGYQVFEWVSEYTTVVSAEEAQMIAAEFVLYGWISEISDKVDREAAPSLFNMSRKSIYHLTERGRRALEWDDSLSSIASSSGDRLIMTAKSSELAAQMQQAIANRLLPTEFQTDPHQGPLLAVFAQKDGVAAVTTPTQDNSSFTVPPTLDATTTTKSPSIMSSDYNCQFGFSNDSQPPDSPEDGESTKGDIQKLDEMTRKMLQIRKAKHVSYLAAIHDVPSRLPSSQDSGFEVSTSVNEVEEGASPMTRPSSINTTTGRSSIPEILAPDDHPKDSQQWIRLLQILENPLTRMYFRDFLKSTFCEENINFWVDHNNLCKKYHKQRAGERELLADCYRIYDVYLAPNAQSEVNIDHQLRQEVVHIIMNTFKVTAAQTTSDLPFSSGAVQITSPQSIVVTNYGKSGSTLKHILRLYDRVNQHVCRTMAQDSVPRFSKTQKYRELTLSSVTTLSNATHSTES